VHHDETIRRDRARPRPPSTISHPESRYGPTLLALAAEIYAPFAERETKRLRQYVTDVEEMVASVSSSRASNP
jgi:hypothetical protein